MVADVVDICTVSQKGAVGKGQGFFAGHPGEPEGRAVVEKLVALIVGVAVVGHAEVKLQPHAVVLKGTELGGDPAVILGQSAGVPADNCAVSEIDSRGGDQPRAALAGKGDALDVHHLVIFWRGGQSPGKCGLLVSLGAAEEVDTPPGQLPISFVQCR